MLPAFENLLTALAEPCGMMKAFLFDVGTKIYVASDSSDVDMQVSNGHLTTPSCFLFGLRRR